METADSPKRKTRRSYFKERTNKDFVGSRKATNVTTHDGDIRRTKEKHRKTSAQKQITKMFVKKLLVKWSIWLILYEET